MAQEQAQFIIFRLLQIPSDWEQKILTTNFSGGYFSLDGGGALSQYKPSMVIKNFTIKENHLGPAVGEILS